MKWWSHYRTYMLELGSRACLWMGGNLGWDLHLCIFRWNNPEVHKKYVNEVRITRRKKADKIEIFNKNNSTIVSFATKDRFPQKCKSKTSFHPWKLTWLAGKSPYFSIGNTYIDSSMVVFSAGVLTFRRSRYTLINLQSGMEFGSALTTNLSVVAHRHTDCFW